MRAACLIFLPQWVGMSQNLIFLGLHFVIGKREVSGFPSLRSLTISTSIRELPSRHVRVDLVVYFSHPPNPARRLNTRQAIRRARPTSSVERGGPILFLESDVHGRKSSPPYSVPSTPARQSLIHDYPAGSSPKVIEPNSISNPGAHILPRSSITTWREVRVTRRQSTWPCEKKTLQ